MKSVSVDVVIRELSRLFPGADCTLDFTNPLELLVATILSAQCTDARVNIVTKSLFKQYRKPEDYVAVSKRALERDIHSCGTYRMKAQAIRESCRDIMRKFDGKVPATMEELLTLRGAGRKTASIVLSCAYGIIAGVPVDTHVTRVAYRLGLTKHKEQTKIEKELMAKTPKKHWVHLGHLLVAHGRKTCVARRPRCEECIFQKMCPSSLVRKRKLTIDN